MPTNSHDYKDLFVGADTQVPLLDGRMTKYINFDNSASTPPMKAVAKAVDDFMAYYSSVHRGSGFKSQLSTHFYEEARDTVIRFMGGDPETHTCAFVKNTTEAVNKLARRFPFTDERNLVITSSMEHHSNDLPWRFNAEVVHVKLLKDGRLDLEDFDAKLEKHADQVALVAISGASNITGYLNPIHDLAEKAHAVGAQFAADCAQLAPHRQVNMLPLDDPRHLDYVVISAHKMYAPYGTGALIGRNDMFEQGDPDMVGGGVVKIVTLDFAMWSPPPDRDEAGSPNHIGAIALATAMKQLEKIGMDNVAAHEVELTTHALKRFPEVPGMRLFGDTDPENAANRLGVLPFLLENIDHHKTAAILGHEFGVGVRNGCFCAHPYIFHLLGLHDEEADDVVQNMIGNKAIVPGLVRASFGLYNTIDEVDTFVDALKVIADDEYHGQYIQDGPTGEYTPDGWQPKFEEYFVL